MAGTTDSKTLADPSSPKFRVEHSPFFLMNRTISTYALRMEQALRRVGADIPRWRVLVLASERGPISVSAIADLAVIRLSTATKVIQRLERDSLVTLQRSKRDARVTEVRITAEGRAVTRLVRSAASTIYREAFAGVSAREICSFNALLARVRSNLSGTLPQPSRPPRTRGRRSADAKAPAPRIRGAA